MKRIIKFLFFKSPEGMVVLHTNTSGTGSPEMIALKAPLSCLRMQ